MLTIERRYLLYRQDNIEGVEHSDRNLKIIYQSVDLAASWLHDPQPVSAKGSGSDRVVDSGQGSLFTAEQLSSVEAIKFEPINTGDLVKKLQPEDGPAEFQPVITRK